jgi:hypothetical protein
LALSRRAAIRIALTIIEHRQSGARLTARIAPLRHSQWRSSNARSTGARFSAFFAIGLRSVDTLSARQPGRDEFSAHGAMPMMASGASRTLGPPGDRLEF